MPKIRLVYDGDWVYTEKEARIHKLTQATEHMLDTIPGVVDNVDSTSTTDALSANMGKALQDQINAITWLNRYLSSWDATTWLPVTDPVDSPRVYSTWDYYIVAVVAPEWQLNYRPYWNSYTPWVASQTVETEELNINDFYIYDWRQWILQINKTKEIIIDDWLSPTSRNAVENRAVYLALTTKQDNILDLGQIRAWAALGMTSVQPWDNITTLTNNVWYQTAWDVAVAISDAISELAPKWVWRWVLTLQKNGTDIDTFSADAHSNKTINITMTKSDVGLGNVDNTSDLDKPISTATQSALDTITWSISTLDTKVDTNVNRIDWEISTINSTLTNHWNRISTNEWDITTIKGDITTIQWDITSISWRLTTAEWDITDIKWDIADIEDELALKANTADVYDKTAIDTKVQQLEDEIEQSGWSSWFWKTATVWLFANASWGNFWLMNNTNQYTTNATYNANRADNTVTWWTVSVDIQTTPFWDTINSVNRMNVYYKISDVEVDSKWIIRPNGSYSNQKAWVDWYFWYLPRYWHNENYQTYSYRATSTVPDEHVYMASYDINWNHITEYKVDWGYDSEALSYRWYWIWARTNPNGVEWAVYYPNLENNSVSRAAFSINYDLSGSIWCTPFAVWWWGKYIYYINEWTSDRSSSYWWPLNLWIFDTTTMSGSDEYWHSTPVWTQKWWKWYQAWNKCRIYFYKYFYSSGNPPETYDYQWWWFEINIDTKEVSNVTNMWYNNVRGFIDAHPKWEYDNFNDWNLLTNMENTSNWRAYFNWEEVWDWYFERWWDNVKWEYCYHPSWLVKYPYNNAVLSLSLNWIWWAHNTLRRWYSTGNWWWAINNIWTLTNYSSSESKIIGSKNILLSLMWSWIQSTSSLSIQPTANNIQDNTLLNMWTINNNTTSTWLELDIDWYIYKWEADILVASSQNNANTAININWDLTKYARVLLLRAEDNNNRYWHSFEFVPKYMPSWDYKINLRYEDYYNNRYFSTISSDRKTISSNFTTYWMLMLGYK